MKEYTIDTNSATNVLDVHTIIANTLNFPEYYGKNLDALYDCLTDMNIPCTIIWKNYKTTEDKIGKGIKEILKTMEDYSKKQKKFKVILN